jgi:hypothetical protein
MVWTIVSTGVALLGIIWGVYRWFDGRKRAHTDEQLGSAKTKVEELTVAVEAAKDRIATDAKIVNLPDADADARLGKWMRD